MLNSQQKKEWAASFKESLDKSQVAIFADYKGIKATEADIFRKQIRDTNGEVKVLKNNIARKAVVDSTDDVKALFDEVVGPTLVAFAYEDAAATAKVINKFAEDNEAFDLKDSLMDGKKISKADIKALADLPSREVMLSMLLSAMQGPARGFVTVLAGVPRALVNVLSAIEKKKAEGGDS